jgi:hypothetical protein
MSEFSDSFHLRGNDATAGVGLLRRAKVAGYAFEPADGWISIAYFEPTLGRCASRDRMVDANEGTLLHYSYAADHGCSVRVYEETRRVCQLAMSFESKRRRPRFDRDAFVQGLFMTAAAADSVSQWLAGKLPERKDRYAVGTALGLPRFEWFSYEYVMRDDEQVDPPPGRHEVDATGKVHVADSDELDIDELIQMLPPTKKVPVPKAGPPVDPELADALLALADVTEVLASRDAQALPPPATPRRPVAKQ